MNTTKRFRVALSFPGYHREGFVAPVATALAERFGEEAVLYDRFHTAEFADADLAFNLPDLYRKQADLIVVVLCGEYVEREWCGLEWRALYSHVKAGNSKQVMLFRADDAEVPGLHDLEGSIPLDGLTPDKAVKHILQRLARNEDKPRDYYLDHKATTTTKADDFRGATSRLIHLRDDGVFEGRDAEWALLDGWWDDALAERSERARVASLVAIGGAGKTTLVARWKDAVLGRDEHGGVERYFDWSFYSQGTRSADGRSAGVRTTGDASAFAAEALKFFGDEALAESNASAWDKGSRIAELAGRHHTLLILDGLEPLQHPPGPQRGELMDDTLRALFEGLKQAGRGLCLVTTRERIEDLARTEGTAFTECATGSASAEVKGDVLSSGSIGKASGTPASKGCTPTDGITPRLDLNHLSDEAGAAVLREHGVVGSDDDLRTAAAEVKGHALTLSMMGRYLALAFERPDIARRDCFQFSEADAETLNGHAFRVFAAYERWLLGEGERGRHGEGERGRQGERLAAVLRLLGLFDRPATPDCVAALCAEPAIPGLTEPLVGLGHQQWTIALHRLRDLGLIELTAWQPLKTTGYDEQTARAEMQAGGQNRTTNIGPPQPFENQQSSSINRHSNESIDAHPLLREYFAQQLPPATATAAHERLFEHLRASVPYWPEGREGLGPLYHAVAHGCQAGRWEQARADVYRDRILRGTAGVHAFYSMFKLGLLGADLSAVACFFAEPWQRLAGELSESDQAWLLSEAAFRLRALNRLTEAREAYQSSAQMCVEQENWKQASIHSGNLSELELTLGDVASAVSTAARAVTFADRTDDWTRHLRSRTQHADALHQAGQREASRERFAEAEALQAKSQPGYEYLYSVQGYQYCDLLFSGAERAAWGVALDSKSEFSNPPAEELKHRGTEDTEPSRDGHTLSDLRASVFPIPEHADALADVQHRAETTLAWVIPQNWLLDIALDHLTLGRVHLLRAVLRGDAASLPLAGDALDTALTTLREANTAHNLPWALLPSAWQAALAGDWSTARARLDEAHGIATRGGPGGSMRLHLIDTLLHRVRLFGRMKDEGGRMKEYPWPDRTPEQDLAEAARLIEATGYHRRDAEVASLQVSSHETHGFE